MFDETADKKHQLDGYVSSASQGLGRVVVFVQRS